MLSEQVARDLTAGVPAEVAAAAAMLGREADAAAVLFYGSVLRTRNLDDVLDFYVLTRVRSGTAFRRAAQAVLWPDVSWRELSVAGRIVHAKVATMTLTTFERACAGRSLDTTVWTRFAQPSAIAWSAGVKETDRATAALADAVTTASRFAAALGPERGTPEAYWQALFDETYRVEFRVERRGRSGELIAHGLDRYRALLPLGWRAAGITFDEADGIYAPRLATREHRRLTAAWFRRKATGRLLNIARLVKAAFTFEGATRYALYKIERHTGIRIAATPWRERHPVLAAPGVLWQVLRARA